MLSFLPGPLLALLSFFAYVVNTLFWVLPLLLCSLLKLIVPLALWQKLFSYLLDSMAGGWVLVNTIIQKLFSPIKLNATGLDDLALRGWYLVVSNHQSWVDILVLQRLLHGKIPFLKFFLKKELIYVPVLGLAWWALDFPFMKRYSQAYLRKNPHLIGTDIETTRKACAKFKHKPVSVMNFIEGTRFTVEKHAKQKPPFQHLLRPKAGGIAFVLDAMGEHLNSIVNVTIHYPDGIPSFYDFVCGKVKQVNIKVEVIPIDENVSGDYFNDTEYKQRFQKWLNKLWTDKDQVLADFNQDN